MNYKITKIEAAKKQLETAVILYFNDKDFISIHTLVGAAKSILEGLYKATDNKKTQYQFICDLSKDKKLRKELCDGINYCQNFFKHAGKDPYESFDYKIEFTEVLFYVTCQDYQKYTGEKNALLRVYELWIMVNNKYKIPISDEQKELSKCFKNMSKKEFFEIHQLKYNNLNFK